jgi:hypothetical protein
MEPNLRCMLCGTMYYSAAPSAVAHKETCDMCGGYLEPMASALVRKPKKRTGAEGDEPAERPRRFARLTRRLPRGRSR